MDPDLGQGVGQLVYRVLDQRGNSVGTAFLVHDDRVLTCAHVVSQAAARRLDAEVALGTAIALDAGEGTAQFRGELELYECMSPGGESGDIALLVAIPPEKSFVWPACWQPEILVQKSEVAAYGFPSGITGGGSVEGDVTGQNVHGRLQVERLRAQGLPVTGGISGAPVCWAEGGGVIGILAASDPAHGLYHVIPFSQIITLCAVPFRFALMNEEGLCQALLRLDFTAQEEAYWRLLRESLCALVVHGPEDHGQGLLAKRITAAWSRQHRRIWRVEFGRHQSTSLVEALYAELGKYLGIPRPARNRELQNRLTKLMRSKEDVVIQVYTGANAVPEDIKTLFAQFWAPLVRDLSPRVSGGWPGRLLMILIDEQDQGQTWSLPPPGTRRRDPAIPVVLPRIEPFPFDKLEQWMLLDAPPLFQTLPTAFSNWLIDWLYHTAGHGLPDPVLEQLCLLYNRVWEPWEARCQDS